MLDSGVNTGFLLAQMLNFMCIGALLAVPIAAVIIFLRRSRSARATKPAFDRQPVRLQDSGHQLTAPLHLTAGTHKLMYWLPDDVLVKVDLIALDDGDAETVLLKKGVGSQWFSVEHSGRYAFQVAPADDSASWVLELSPLGLPGKTEP